MRTLKRISPSSLAKFEKDRESFYLFYCSEAKPERDAQPKPASVGSSFDAFVKAKVQHDLMGDPYKETLDNYFESQVEPQHRDFAWGAGKYIFEEYVASGVYGKLMDLLKDSESAQFEFDANTEVGGIKIAGKPDCRFIHRQGAHVVLDWKVNGFCGKSGTSPSKGYSICVDGTTWDKPSRSNGKSHHLYEPEEFMGLEVNKFFMEQISIDWADQLAMYGWMMGEPVGSQEMVLCIDQIVCKPRKGFEYPSLRFASFRTRVSVEHQKELFNRLQRMWEAVHSQHIFPDLTAEENEELCKELERRARAMKSDGTPEGDFFARCAKPKSFYRGR